MTANPISIFPCTVISRITFPPSLLLFFNLFQNVLCQPTHTQCLISNRTVFPDPWNFLTSCSSATVHTALRTATGWRRPERYHTSLLCTAPCCAPLISSLAYSLTFYSPRIPCFCPPASVSVCNCIHLYIRVCMYIYIYVYLCIYLSINIVSDHTISCSFCEINLTPLFLLTHCRQARQVQRLLSQVCRS